MIQKTYKLFYLSFLPLFGSFSKMAFSTMAIDCQQFTSTSPPLLGPSRFHSIVCVTQYIPSVIYMNYVLTDRKVFSVGLIHFKIMCFYYYICRVCKSYINKNTIIAFIREFFFSLTSSKKMIRLSFGKTVNLSFCS